MNTTAVLGNPPLFYLPSISLMLLSKIDIVPSGLFKNSILSSLVK